MINKIRVTLVRFIAVGISIAILPLNSVLAIDNVPGGPSNDMGVYQQDNQWQTPNKVDTTILKPKPEIEEYVFVHEVLRPWPGSTSNPDVNGDGIIDANDVAALKKKTETQITNIQKSILGVIPTDPSYDVNGDGTVNMADVTALQLNTNKQIDKIENIISGLKSIKNASVLTLIRIMNNPNTANEVRIAALNSLLAKLSDSSVSAGAKEFIVGSIAKCLAENWGNFDSRWWGNVRLIDGPDEVPTYYYKINEFADKLHSAFDAILNDKNLAKYVTEQVVNALVELVQKDSPNYNAVRVLTKIANSKNVSFVVRKAVVDPLCDLAKKLHVSARGGIRFRLDYGVYDCGYSELGLGNEVVKTLWNMLNDSSVSVVSKAKIASTFAAILSDTKSNSLLTDPTAASKREGIIEIMTANVGVFMSLIPEQYELLVSVLTQISNDKTDATNVREAATNLLSKIGLWKTGFLPKLDINGDGNISPEDLIAINQKLKDANAQWKSGKISQSDLEKIVNLKNQIADYFKAVSNPDINGDGKTDASDALNLIEKGLVSRLDVNGDGKIDSNDVLALKNTMANAIAQWKSGQITMYDALTIVNLQQYLTKTIENFIKALDTDGDGVTTRDDMVRLTNVSLAIAQWKSGKITMSDALKVVNIWKYPPKTEETFVLEEITTNLNLGDLTPFFQNSTSVNGK